jgi:F0F1-type ATP synthase assembly protein I
MANTAQSIRKLAILQLLLLAATSVVFFMIYGAFQAASVWCGGLIAMTNVLLLAWRQRCADTGRAMSAGESLRLLYRTAVERFVLVILLFVIALGMLQLDPLALITGFIAGQLAMVLTELIK